MVTTPWQMNCDANYLAPGPCWKRIKGFVLKFVRILSPTQTCTQRPKYLRNLSNTPTVGCCATITYQGRTPMYNLFNVFYEGIEILQGKIQDRIHDIALLIGVLCSLTSATSSLRLYSAGMSLSGKSKPTHNRYLKVST